MKTVWALMLAMTIVALFVSTEAAQRRGHKRGGGGVNGSGGVNSGGGVNGGGRTNVGGGTRPGGIVYDPVMPRPIPSSGTRPITNSGSEASGSGMVMPRPPPPMPPSGGSSFGTSMGGASRMPFGSSSGTSMGSSSGTSGAGMSMQTSMHTKK